MDWKTTRCTLILLLLLIQEEMLQLIQRKFFMSLTIIGVIATCHLIRKFLATSDVQNVTAIEVDEYTVKVHCYFINGSDAQGCLVVFTSSFGQVDNQIVRLESNSTAWEEISLDRPISCYHRVLAFDIEAGGNVSDIAI